MEREHTRKKPVALPQKVLSWGERKYPCPLDRNSYSA